MIVSNLSGRERRGCSIILCRSISSTWDSGSLRHFGLRRAQIVCMSRSRFCFIQSFMQQLLWFCLLQFQPCCNGLRGSNWKYFVWRCNGLLKGSECVKGRSSVVKWLGLLILLTVQHRTLKISGAVAAKNRSIDGSHILLKTISALEGLSVRMSAVFCPSHSFCVLSWQLSRQAYSCLYYPSYWLASAELHIRIFF